MTSQARRLALAAILAAQRGHSCKQQRARLITAIETLGSVTTYEAMRYLDIYDPRPRKLELVALGYDIVCVMDTATTESGETHRIGRYMLNTTPSDAWGVAV